MSNYDSVDLDWTWNGDFLIGQDGDFADTSDDYLRSLVNEIQTIVKSDYGDWLKQPALGAGLSEFKGEPNSRETGKAIENRLISKLTSSNLLRKNDIQVRVTPVHVNQVLIIIRVQADASPGNSLTLGQPIVVNALYDSSENDIFFLPINQKERNSRSP